MVAWSQYLPLAVAGTAAAAVAYLALAQAAAALEGEASDAPSSSAGASTRASSGPGGRRPAGRAQPAAPGAAPVRSRATSSDGGGSSSASSSGGTEQCSHCGKVPDPDHHLLRCSRCQHVWYCNKACQRAAWPKHKAECGASASSSSDASPTHAGHQHASGGGAAAKRGSSDGQGSDDTSSMMDVLKTLLAQHSASGASSDELQQQFEAAVLMFVRQEHAAAVGALQAVQAAAEAQGRLSLAGDAAKWLGHAQLKAGNAGCAASAFAAGCELAERSGNKRLQVDCLSGMGIMYRDAGQLSAAGGFLRQALRIAAALGDDALRASVLTHLGTLALAGGDAAAAMRHLEEAVALREEQVVALHESGQRGSALATAIMEHAGSLVSLAGAYYVSQRYRQAADAYSKSLTIFTMIEDTDKQLKCLINLANLYELQMTHPDARANAAEQRRQLYELARDSLGREVPEACGVCCECISPLRATPEGGELVLLGCAHTFHQRCVEHIWGESHGAGCPSCKQPSAELAAAQQAVAKHKHTLVQATA